jgi:hypothetical protein
MINRTFENLKLKRTYIGGSKERELEIFLKVQGNSEDNSDCDWLEYHRILVQYFDDILHVVLSWKYVMKCLSYGLMFIALYMLFKNIHVFAVIQLISSAFYISYLYFKNKEKKNLSNYNCSLDITLAEIKRQTGFELSKN